MKFRGKIRVRHGGFGGHFRDVRFQVKSFRGSDGYFRGGSRKPGGGVFRGRGRLGVVEVMPSKNIVSHNSFPEKKFSDSVDTNKLIVTNLDSGITDCDIMALFSELRRPIRSAQLYYDHSGQSLGTVELIFERESDAINAMEQYNGVHLDGRAMEIEFGTIEFPVVRIDPIGSKSVGFGRKGPKNKPIVEEIYAGFE